jgi:thiol-disulfide isomerase/thioredoxin
LKKVLLILTSSLAFLTAFCQTPADTAAERPVYLRFPTIPQFTIYKAPDSTAFSRSDLAKRKNTIFMVFSPDCSHCQHETEMLLKDINKFKNTQIVMVTYLPYPEMLQFYRIYKIANYPQITMARDTRFFFPVFFKITNLPSLFLYDRKGNFIKAYEGDVKPETILSRL